MNDDSRSTTASQCAARGDDRLRQLARDHGFGEDAAESVATIDAVMGRIRRSMSRRDFGRRIIERMGAPIDVQHMDVLGAIALVEVDAAAIEEVTVGLVAERIGVDPSRASRLVGEVVDFGYARRVASQSDSRRICLELTAKGRNFIEAVRETKLKLFADALGAWQEDELIVFARLLDRFSSWTTDALGKADGPAAPLPVQRVRRPGVGVERELRTLRRAERQGRR